MQLLAGEVLVKFSLCPMRQNEILHVLFYANVFVFYCGGVDNKEVLDALFYSPLSYLCTWRYHIIFTQSYVLME